LNPLPFTRGVPIFNQDVLALNTSTIPQPLPERLDCRPRIGRIAGTRQKSYPRNIPRLLRNRGIDFSKNDRCEYREKKSRLHRSLEAYRSFSD
jgi:hypothetical protein